MSLAAYETFAEEPLVFPIGGKTYTHTEPTIPNGIRLNAIMTGTAEDSAALTEIDLWRLALGPLWDEMIADGVPLRAATRAGLAALTDFQYGRQLAEAAWVAGANPKALEAYLTPPAPNRATRRSPSTAKATTTKKPANSSGTISRPISRSPKA
jgi:hypothetical protein